MMRFDRFTERAQEAAQRAVGMLQRYGHTQVDTEHILLALLEQPEGVVGQILEKLGADAATMAGQADDLLRALSHIPERLIVVTRAALEIAGMEGASRIAASVSVPVLVL